MFAYKVSNLYMRSFLFVKVIFLYMRVLVSICISVSIRECSMNYEVVRFSMQNAICFQLIYSIFGRPCSHTLGEPSFPILIFSLRFILGH